MKIYLEKPGFTTLEESKELVELQSKFKLDITIGYHFPYQKRIQRIYELLNTNKYGLPLSIDIYLSKEFLIKVVPQRLRMISYLSHIPDCRMH